jgi:PAS domain S-box-containing protein
MTIIPPNGSPVRSAQFPSQLPHKVEVIGGEAIDEAAFLRKPVDGNTVSNTIALKRRQMAALYLAMPSSMSLSFVGTLFTFLMLYTTGDAQRGVIWLAFATGVVLYRAVLYWQYSLHVQDIADDDYETQTYTDPEILTNPTNTSTEAAPRKNKSPAPRRLTHPDVWVNFVIFGNVLAGIQWGLLGTWLYVADPVYRALFSVIVIMGYVGGAVVPYASVRFAHIALAIPAAVPPIIYLFFIRADGNWIAGSIAIFMFGAIVYMAEKQYHIIRRRILSEMENEQHRMAAEERNTTLGVRLKKLEHRTEVVKRAQVEARRRAATLGLHMETTLLPVIECDINGRIIEWNPAAEETFGYRHADLADVSLSDLVTASDTNVDWKTFFEVALNRKAPTSIDVFMRAADGNRQAVRLYLTPIDIDGKPDKKAARAAIIVTNTSSEIARRRSEKLMA